MHKELVMAKLKALKPLLKQRYGIESFAVFGSVARGEASQSSDVDIVVLKMKPKSGFDLIRAKHLLKEELRTKIDIGTLASMKHFIKERIKKDLVYV